MRERDVAIDEDGDWSTHAGGSVLWCRRDVPGSKLGYALEGDSHGGSLVREFLEASRTADASARLFAMTDQGPTAAAARDLVATLEPDRRWIVGSYFRQNVQVEPYEEHLRVLADHPGVAALVVFLDNPFMETWRSPSLLLGPADQSRTRSEELRPRDRVDMLVRLRETVDVPIIVADPFDGLCDATTCFGGRDGVVWYIDEDHLSVGGMRQLRTLTRDAFATAVAATRVDD
jgi:hypothetical protein